MNWMNLKITRKNLLKWAGIAAAGIGLPRAVRARVLTRWENPPPLDGEEQRPALCKMCPAICMLQIRVVGGNAVGVSGMPGHPVNQGALCPKGAAALQDLYHPDRLKTPLRRKGPRRSGQWEKISWEEAKQILSEKLGDLLRRNRPEALALIATPIQDIRHEIQRRFAEALGTPNFWEWNWAFSEPPLDAWKKMHGFSEGLFYDLSRADLIVSFGWDWLQSSPSPLEAQRAYANLRRGRPARRTRILHIEPRLSVTASKADDWIPVRPDTEGVFALGVAHVLLRDGLYDRGFVERWTSGFDRFQDLIRKEYPPRKVAEITGAGEEAIRRVAREMASTRPALAMTWRASFFQQAAVHSLNVLLGSIGVRRGVLFTEAQRHRLSLPPTRIQSPRAEPLASLHRLPEAILAGPQSPIEVLWLERTNPVFLSPCPARWKKALERIPFIVSFSSYMDESTQLSNLVLPPHHFLEAWQYGFSRTLTGEGVLSFSPPPLAPLHDTADHGDFVLGLAASLGGRVAEALPWKSFVEALEAAARQAGPGLPKEGGWRVFGKPRPDIPSTMRLASGKLEFPSRELEAQTPRRAEPPEPPDPSYPLQLHIHVPLAYSFGEGGHLPYLHSIAGAHLGEQWETWVEIHPLTAKTIGIGDGATVWVESAAGKIRAKARYYEGIRHDAVSLPFGMGHEAMGRYAKDIGASPAGLLPPEFDEAGQPRWQSGWVKVYEA